MEQRKPGRPKKGNKSWKPASQLDLAHKNPEYGYRFCRKDDENINRKLMEGWEFVNDITDSNVQLDTKEPTNPVTGGKNVRELVVMRMHKDDIEARKAYYDAKADHQERGLKAELEEKANAKGRITGDIKIETIT